MANVSLRVGMLGAALLIATAACGGGFGGSTAAPSAAAPTEAAAATEAAATAEATATAAAAEPVTLGYLIGDAVTVQARAKGLTEAYTKLHPNVTFDIQTVPGGAEGDNALKTQLATGTAPDLVWYNSGALLSNINPEKTLVDLTNEPFIANIVETAIPSLSVNGKVYGVPSEDAGAAGILYNKKIYSDLGLSVPTTWAEFAANNEKIKAAGIAPVGASFGDTWTSQFMFLADYCNVQNAVPDFAEQFTAGTAKFETTPGRPRRLQQARGRVQERLVAGGLRRDQVPRCPEHAHRREDRPVPDRVVRDRRDRRHQPGRAREHRLLRDPR